MRIDVGKNAKHKGATSPRNARRVDPEPPRPVSKAKPKGRKVKAFGFSYEYETYRYRRGGGPEKYVKVWEIQEMWYETEIQRDQALRAHKHKSDPRWYRNHKAIGLGERKS